MASAKNPRAASLSSHSRWPSLFPPVPCSTSTAGRRVGGPAGRTISTGTRSMLPSRFFSLANCSFSTTTPPSVLGSAVGFGSSGTFGRSSSLRNSARTWAGRAGGRHGSGRDHGEHQDQRGGRAHGRQLNAFPRRPPAQSEHQLAGISTTSRAPPSGEGPDATEMSPPWSITILRTMARPSPVPGGLLVT
jgi:hypothetical protein